jgi:hypothetical protein
MKFNDTELMGLQGTSVGDLGNEECSGGECGMLLWDYNS